MCYHITTSRERKNKLLILILKYEDKRTRGNIYNNSNNKKD